MSISGAISGLAGAIMVLGVAGNIGLMASQQGYGFDGMAVALIAGNNPLACIPSGLLFAGLKYGGGKLNSSLNTYSEVVDIVIGIIIFFIAMPRLLELISSLYKKEGGKIMSTILGIISITLLYSAPLIFTALGGVISENGGVVNIGLEGMMTIGAIVGATVGFYTGNPWFAFLCGGLGGMALALFHAIATINFQADHVVSGIAINLIGPGLSLFLCRIFFDGAAMSKSIPFKNKLPQLFLMYLQKS